MEIELVRTWLIDEWRIAATGPLLVSRKYPLRRHPFRLAKNQLVPVQKSTEKYQRVPTDYRYDLDGARGTLGRCLLM